MLCARSHLTRAPRCSNSDLIVTAWWKFIGWSCYITVRKPLDVTGKPAIQYKSFKGLPPAKWGY